MKTFLSSPPEPRTVGDERRPPNAVPSQDGESPSISGWASGTTWPTEYGGVCYFLSPGLKKQVGSNDGNFYVLTWLDHGVPRYLATHYCWVFLSEISIWVSGLVKQFSLPIVGWPPPAHWGPGHKGWERKSPASPAWLSELRHSSSPALSPRVLRSLNSGWITPQPSWVSSFQMAKHQTSRPP